MRPAIVHPPGAAERKKQRRKRGQLRKRRIGDWEEKEVSELTGDAVFEE
jgi:hypothetical protein